MPVAPDGNGSCDSVIWGAPAPSVQRTRTTCFPASNGHSYLQMTQVVSESGGRRVASCQSPSSTWTSTREMPRAPAWAIPPTGTKLFPPRSIRRRRLRCR